MIREYSLSVISFLSSNCFKKESCILYLIKLLFFKIFPLSRNKRFMLKRGINRTAGGDQHHGTFTPAWFSRGPTHCLRRFERSDCGCKGVSALFACRCPQGAALAPRRDVVRSAFPRRGKVSWRVRRPARREQNVSAALCCSAVILRAFFVKVQQVQQSERGKGKPFRLVCLVSSW